MSASSSRSVFDPRVAQRFVHAVHGPQERRLAQPDGPMNRGDAVAGNIQTDVVQRLNAP